MVSFKTFMKIRYPEFENERIVFTPIRPDIDKMMDENRFLSDTPYILTFLYKGYLVKKEIFVTNND